MSTIKDRFEDPYDAVLHLLDRQVIDSEGLFVCKVDDLELTAGSGGSDALRATGILAGSAALLGRLSPKVRDLWERLGDERADRKLPYRIGLEQVAEVTSAVRLSTVRHQVLHRSDPELRLSALLACRVCDASGASLGHILDVRLDDSQQVVGVIVGRGRPGSLLGYDRNADQGPVLVRGVVRRLHRHTAYAPWSSVTSLDWSAQRLVVDTPLEPLTAAATPD